MMPCTPSVEPAFTATVTDARSAQPLEATITIQDGTFRETLGPYGFTATGQTIYGGAFERPGIYTVTIAKPGYRTLVMPNVQVTQDTCHVQTRKLTVQLQPQTNPKPPTPKKP